MGTSTRRLYSQSKKPQMAAGAEGRGAEMRNYIVDEQGINIHDKELMWLNALMIDLKLQLLGKEHQPITLERLAEWNPLHSSLNECKRKVKIR